MFNGFGLAGFMSRANSSLLKAAAGSLFVFHLFLFLFLSSMGHFGLHIVPLGISVYLCASSQYHRTFNPLSVSLWTDLADFLFYGVRLEGFNCYPGNQCPWSVPSKIPY